MKVIPAIAWTIAGLILIAWLVYVWPTPWRDYKDRNMNLRVNRFTGDTQVLQPTGWEKW